MRVLPLGMLVSLLAACTEADGSGPSGSKGGGGSESGGHGGASTGSGGVAATIGGGGGAVSLGEPSTNPGGATVGGPCGMNDDCLLGGYCFKDVGGVSWNAGYCALTGCNAAAQSGCLDGSTCITLGPGVTACLAKCFPPDIGQANCRKGYTCQLINEAHEVGDGVCVPPCSASSCPPGLSCNASNGVCETELCKETGSPNECGAQSMCCALPPPNEAYVLCQPDCRIAEFATICPSLFGLGATCDGGSGCCTF